MITFDNERGIFKLDTENSSYLIALNNNILYHLYWGKRVSGIRRAAEDMFSLKGTSFSALDDGVKWGRSADVMPMEYPTYGSPDLRTPAMHLRYANGSSATALRYSSHSIVKGKPGLPGLPATYAEQGDRVETLSITLTDKFSNVDVILNYSVWYDYNAIARSTVIKNKGSEPVFVLSANSVCFDITDSEGLEMLNLYGAWGRERTVERLPLRHGIQIVDSKRGASSHSENPFLALLSKNSDELTGDVYGINLVFSGNFAGGVELDGYNTARVFMGINPFDFGYKLLPGEDFVTPEAVMVFSDKGLSGMSRSYHSLYRSRICRGKFRDIERPVLINNWEATYFDFNEEKIIGIAKKAKELGIELLVVDDGWFGKRNSDVGYLGDWNVNTEKLQNGLPGIARKINELGMKFGLWLEPEAVSCNSDLYRAHPDWCIHIEGRKSCLGRNELLLDLSRPEVCDYLISRISEILDSANIEYIKWDMNRNMSEIGSAAFPADNQGEIAYRYILGLYRILESVTSKYPNVLFEGCSGGGGRFDAGMLYYMPQIWTSDVTDAEERLKIQYGTSIVYPFSSMGAHVAAVPNHQLKRSTPFAMRGNAALMGQFGYELDLNTLNENELETAKAQIAFYKKYGHIMHRGECFRISSPFDSELSVIQFISPDKNTVLVNICCKYALPNAPFKRIVLTGLEGDAVYTEKNGGLQMTGAELCTIGIPFVNGEEHFSDILVFNRLVKNSASAVN